MKTHEFVERMKERLRVSTKNAIIENLIKVPGRKPRKKLLEMSQWYNNLSAEDKKQLEKVILESIDFTAFSVFTVLDGEGFIETEGNPHDFELYAVKDGKKTLINDPNEEMLHDIYMGAVDEEEGNL
jgi:hypothetical protein